MGPPEHISGTPFDDKMRAATEQAMLLAIGLLGELNLTENERYVAQVLGHSLFCEALREFVQAKQDMGFPRSRVVSAALAYALKLADHYPEFEGWITGR
jgi:hypothetical protein